MNITRYPWGFETTWANTKKYSSKMIVVLKGHKTPYIYHKKRDKTLFILQGIVLLVIEGKFKTLKNGESYHIPPSIKHQILSNEGEAVILEVGTELSDDEVVVGE